MGVLNASMGPQLYSCGKRWYNRHYDRPGAASMGPQLYSCGKSLALASLFAWLASASMGPQLYSCGKNRNRPQAPQSETSFNGAATLQLRKEVMDVTDHPADKEASMGPQLYSCGKSDGVSSVERVYPASMGPQLYSCGKPRTPNTSPCRGGLQWGSNFTGAESNPVNSRKIK